MVILDMYGYESIYLFTDAYLYGKLEFFKILKNLIVGKC